MGKNKKQNLIELLKTLNEAISYIKFNIDSDYSFMIKPIMDAINAIINQLKSFSSIDDKLIDNIKKISEWAISLKENRNKDNIVICEQMTICVNEMIEIINTNLNKKIDIVFMPYNASMWNSLESIYKSAVNDDRVNCYVVPIPYYKINDSGENGEREFIFTYEGNKFPKDIPIVHYKDFDLEKVNPDIIYVHNQYDDCNLATRVESDYYSYNLKKFTKMLVYVPYCLLGTYPVSFEFNFLKFIGYRNFDKVVIPSPIFGYIANESGISKENILITGSPKFDALFNALETNNKELKKIKGIENKTVFLWTTNLMKIVNTRHEAIDQIEDLFNYIEKNNEYMLIYRPHPLELDYVKSKAPECYKRYKELIDSIEYRENIELDTNTSYYESFNMSDGLITDRSSILMEYIKTEKPILIYDIKLERDLYDENIFDIFSNYIVGVDGMDVEKFINLVKDKKDDKLKFRLDALNKAVVNTDGTCGKKTHYAITEDFIDNYL